MDPFEDTGATGAHSELAFPLKIPSYLLNTPPEHEVPKRSSINRMTSGLQKPPSSSSSTVGTSSKPTAPLHLQAGAEKSKAPRGCWKFLDPGIAVTLVLWDFHAPGSTARAQGSEETPGEHHGPERERAGNPRGFLMGFPLSLLVRFELETP